MLDVLPVGPECYSGLSVIAGRVRKDRVKKGTIDQSTVYALKPLVSTLFPVTFEHGVLTASNELADGSLVCAGDGPTLYAGARDELHYYFGAALVAELDRLAR